jgi:hypothetical protein
MAKSPAEGAKSQREKFIEAAREAGTVENEREFERQLKAVAGANSSAGDLEKPKKKASK